MRRRGRGRMRRVWIDCLKGTYIATGRENWGKAGMGVSRLVLVGLSGH